MEHIAIDLGGRESQICVRGEDGEILEERRVSTQKLGGFLQGRPLARVILETCSESFAIADEAVAAGHEVRVVPATLVRSLGVGARGVKTDRKDAQVLSEVSCRIDLPSVHIASAQSRQLKSLCGMREELIGARTKLINTVRGWLRGSATRLRSGCTTTFAKRVRERLSRENRELPTYVDRQLRAIEQLCEEIREADREVAGWAKKNEVCRRLMTVPGVGAVTAVRFVACLDDVSRFRTAHAVQSYLGLVPGEDSSSDRKRRTSITKAGASKLRWTLIQAAWSTRRSRLDPMTQWSLQIETRRGKHVAVTALARKLAGVLFALWRDGTTYNPLRMMKARS